MARVLLISLLLSFAKGLSYYYSSFHSGYGHTNMCRYGNTFMGGYCGSGKWGDCDGAYTEIMCYTTAYGVGWDRGSLTDWYRGGYGDFINCPNQHVAVGACGSGKNGDCEGTYNLLRCSDALYGHLDMEASVIMHGDYGQDMNCPSGYLVTGLCGSGKNADCYGDDYIYYYAMIRCTPLKPVPESTDKPTPAIPTTITTTPISHSQLEHIRQILDQYQQRQIRDQFQLCLQSCNRQEFLRSVPPEIQDLIQYYIQQGLEHCLQNCIKPMNLEWPQDGRYLY